MDLTGIDIDGQHLVEWNTIHGCEKSALALSTQAEGSVIRGNTIYANGEGIELSGQANAIVIVHNTVYGNQANGVFIANNIHDVDLRNNLISNNGAWGLDAQDTNFSQRDYNAFYLNASGDCLGCSQLGSQSITVNPRFIDSTTYDLRLRSESSLIDRAIDLGIDVNGAAPGNANGQAPDIGAWEAP
jgi:parallel beta-helix repeat protein